MLSVKCEQVTCELSGTRYRLVLYVDPEGGLIVTWPDMKWGAWASQYVSGEVRPWCKGPTKTDLANIARILDEVIRPTFTTEGARHAAALARLAAGAP